MSKIDELLSRLDGVRQTSKVSWMSRCPHHTDKSPSLRITVKGDRVLIHCFAGCGSVETAKHYLSGHCQCNCRTMGETMRNDHDNLRHYRYAREHDRYKTAAWPEPAWKSLLKIAGAMVGAVAMVAVFWLLTTGLFLL